MKCEKCGRELRENAKFCSGCGSKVKEIVQVEKNETGNKVLVIILSIVLLCLKTHGAFLLLSPINAACDTIPRV